MADAILVLNAGSSSLKFSAFRTGTEPALLVRGQVEAIGTDPRFRAVDATGRDLGTGDWNSRSGAGHESAVEFVLSWAGARVSSEGPLVGAGHRVVHGGAKFAGPARINRSVLQALRDLTPLAPLHQRQNIAAIEAVGRLAPDLPQVACFDTAFHASQPAVARAFAIPRRYSDAGVVRYGFHGLSYEYIAGMLPTLDPKVAAGRVIVAHLGNGASLCAIRNGRSVATTMGFSTLDGLVMGTRCGAIDPGVLLHLASHEGLGIEELGAMLYERSGLLGVSGISGDMRTLLESAEPRAREAVELFVYRAVREIGSLAAALGGLDGIVFTGGLGENAPTIRAALCGALGWMGLELDAAANAGGGPRISRPHGPVGAWVVPTNEELMIARHTARLLAGGREEKHSGEADVDTAETAGK
jgi:acetate kinase